MQKDSPMVRLAVCPWSSYSAQGLNFLIRKMEITLVLISGGHYEDTVYKGLNTVPGIQEALKSAGYYFEQINL